jgi:membrane protein implicated in regulation of membrane protease activity
VTSLFGRNPIAMAVIGAALLVIGLTTHSLFMPWIGGALLAVGAVKTATRLQKRGPADSEGEGRLPR